MKPVEIAERLWMVHPCRGVECCFDPEKVALQVATMIAEEREEEREACAKVADGLAVLGEVTVRGEPMNVLDDLAVKIAAAIRDRGQG